MPIVDAQAHISAADRDLVMGRALCDWLGWS
jgi:hypothetical protein